MSLNIDLGDGADRLSVELAKIRWSTRHEFGVEFLIFKDDGETRVSRAFWPGAMSLDQS